jgi:bifunctional protein TilS/HprT
VVSRQRTYYRATRRAAALLDSDAPLEPVLTALMRITARAMEAAASLLVLDRSGKKLIHRSSWGLARAYLQKGLLDIDRSLGEIATGQPVAISNVATNSHLQYPELAIKAGIVSILGMPLFIKGKVAGSIRVYTRQRTDFGKQDISFLATMAHLVALAVTRDVPTPEKQQAGSSASRAEALVAGPLKGVVFAHPSEEEFARILDFYHIEWVYEPRSFPLCWEGDKVVEMLTPDFYLPALDLYVELTTLKQSLVTEKNRKLRRLKELYPEIKVSLLYKKDFHRLLAKYGHGPLAQARGRGVSRVLYSNSEIEHRVRELAEQISADYVNRHPIMVGVLRGVFCFMADLIRQMTIPVDVEFMAISYYGGQDSSAVKITKDVDLNVTGRDVIMVEDIVDTGMTLNYILNHLKAKGLSSLVVCALLDKRVRRIVDVPIKYVGFQVPDEFVVGYGLDYREEYRNLPFIGVLKPEEVTADSSLKELSVGEEDTPG